MTCFPLTSLSIAAAIGKMDKFGTPEALARHMSGLKSKAKTVTGSCWVMEILDTGTIQMGTAFSKESTGFPIGSALSSSLHEALVSA